MTDTSQKFIARNRAPRVQIEYDVELYGAQKKVQLPFVMGVMSDLAGKSRVEQPAVADRKFLEIDADNFDDRMQAMAPRVAFTVPNTLTGEGNLAVDLTFGKMADFSPAAIAEQVEALRPLLEARRQLATLMAYMDGKSGAEALIEKILADPALLAALSGATPEAADREAALASLRALAPEPGPEHEGESGAGDVLEALKAAAPAAPVPEDRSGAILDDLKAAAPEQAAAPDSIGAALAGLQAAMPATAPEEDSTGAGLAALRASAPKAADPVGGDQAAEVLAGLAATAPSETLNEDPTSDLLADLARSAPEAAAEADPTDDLLADLAASAQEEEVVEDPTADLLADLAASAPEERAAADQTDDPFAELAAAIPEETPDDDPTSDLLADLVDAVSEETPDDDPTDDLFADLAAAAPAEEVEADPTDDLLADLAAAAPRQSPDDDPAEDLLADLAASAPEEEADPTDDLLADLVATAPEEAVDADPTDDLLADLAAAAPRQSPDDDPAEDLLADLAASAPEEEADPTDDLLADLVATAPEEAVDADPTDDLLADLAAAAPEATPDDDPADDPFADLLEASPVAAVEEVGAWAGDDGGSAGLDDLDDLLGDLDDLDDLGIAAAPAAEVSEPATEGAAGLDDLDDLLGDLGDEPAEEAVEEVGVEAGESPVEAAEAADLDDLLGDLDSDPAAAPAPAGATLTGAPAFAFGSLSSERPAAERLSRRRFRIAVLGDFSGRAARGLVETGAALAVRRATLLDPDTVEQIIESFATDLVLPLGQDGAGIEVRLGGLDDLHPDALFENVALFSELAGLRRQLSGGATAESAVGRLRAWGEAHGTPVAPPRRQSGGNAVRADLKLGDFQRLIGAPAAAPAPSPIDDLLARVVGPHIRALPDPDAAAMIGAVDRALSAAMRMLLHHPEFQSVEAQWRALDLIARSIETDDRLEVMLYDISAEEIAADLASHDDLSQSGFARLLTEAPLDPETGRGGYSALIGLYTFEETPPHAELLGRIARVAAHVDAPFLAAIGPGFLEVEKQDRHPLVAQAWDGLRALPEAGHLGLLTPRVLLRRPYGAKTEPIYEFDFEEFTPAEGVSGLLWGNPAVLAAILLAQSFRRNGPSMDLGSVMSLGDMPYHYVTDRYGDQVALPCTERNLTQARVEFAMARGLMPVVSIKGRDEVRLASFQSLAGGEILGPWSGAPRPEPSTPEPMPAPVEATEADLDDLLAGFAGGDPAVPLDPEAIDADLAALLDDL